MCWHRVLGSRVVQKRHGLTPLELALFIRVQVDTGDSDAIIAKQLGMNLTTIADHLAWLDLPPVGRHLWFNGTT